MPGANACTSYSLNLKHFSYILLMEVGNKQEHQLNDLKMRAFEDETQAEQLWNKKKNSQNLLENPHLRAFELYPWK